MLYICAVHWTFSSLFLIVSYHKNTGNFFTLFVQPKLNITVNAIPTLSAAVGSDPSSCGGNDGEIAFTFTNVGDGAVTVNYVDENGAAQSLSGTVSNNEMTITGLSAGDYYDLAITVAGCTSVENVDITLSVDCSPELLADKTSTFVDANNDGQLNPGEQIDYSITLFHTANSMGTATDLVFIDGVPTNTTLTANSVTVAYSGAGSETINTGNATTDSEVNISLGDLDNSETITITFSERWMLRQRVRLAIWAISRP